MIVEERDLEIAQLGDTLLVKLRLEEGVSFRRRTALGRERVAPCLLALTRRSPMAARYKSRAIAEYAPERIPELCGAVTGRSHASSAQGAWSDWVNDLPGNLPQLTPASMLMPLVAQLPPPDMRLPPKPIRRLDPAALRHFHLQAVAGAPPPATAIDGGPLPAQAVASQEAASSSLSGRSSADGSQKSVSRTEAISQLALSLVEARPRVSGCTPRRLHKPRHATHPPTPPTHPPTHPLTLGARG